MQGSGPGIARGLGLGEAAELGRRQARGVRRRRRARGAVSQAVRALLPLCSPHAVQQLPALLLHLPAAEELLLQICNTNMSAHPQHTHDRCVE